MTGTLLVLLVCIIIMPFCFREVEENLEIFLFCMGMVAAFASGSLQPQLILAIATDRMVYLITGAVFLAGFLFEGFHMQLQELIGSAVQKIPLRLLCALIVLCLGLAASVITAIVAALMLVEIAASLPVSREHKIDLCVLSCFSIGLGAALTPAGEPLAALVTGTLDADFFFLAETIGMLVLPGILFLSAAAAVVMGRDPKRGAIKPEIDQRSKSFSGFSEIWIRTGKIFLFMIALELLSAGFRPVLSQLILGLSGPTLYWVNILSAVLDNATLAAAEVTPGMTGLQLKSVLMGLLISGGILIPGNISNIVCAEGLKISSGEWARRGLPMGLTLLTAYGWVLFVR